MPSILPVLAVDGVIPPKLLVVPILGLLAGGVTAWPGVRGWGSWGVGEGEIEFVLKAGGCEVPKREPAPGLARLARSRLFVFEISSTSYPK